MKITFIVTKLNSGGGEYHDIIRQARALAESGHELKLLTIFPKLNKITDELPYEIIEEPAPSNRLFALQYFIYKLLKKYSGSTDIFYVFATAYLFGGGLYRLIRGSKPVVAYINGYADYVEGFYRREPIYPRAYLAGGRNWFSKIKHTLRVWLERLFGVYLINHLDAIIMMTRTIARHYTRIGVKKEKISIIPSFHDIITLQKLPAGSNPFASFPPDAFHILFTGRFHIEKGVDILLKAFLQCDCPEAILHLVGDGPEKANLEKIIKENGISEKVKFYPWQNLEKLAAFYRHADLFVHPARLPEPLVRTTVEAMAFGLPIVATDTAAEDWFKKEAAITFPLGDVNGCARAIHEAYQDKNFRENAKENNKKRALEFDYRKQIIKLNNILAKVYE